MRSTRSTCNGMIDLYVYYKVRDEQADRLAPLVRAMQTRLARSHGVAGQLKRRPEAKDGMQTWMEIYLATDAAFGAALSFAAHEAGLAAFTQGERRTEIFTDLTPCA
jgi:hypothetical protein